MKKQFTTTNVANIIFDFENGIYREKCLAKIIEEKIELPFKFPKNILKSKDMEEVQVYIEGILKKR